MQKSEQFFIAEAPGLPGCMAHGGTHEAALSNAGDAIRLRIGMAQEFGDHVPESRGLMYA